MSDELATATSTDLLRQLTETGNETAWREIVARYRPTILGFALRYGLSAHDAEDAAQQTLMAFNTAFLNGQYDRSKGRLRYWLFGIARNQISKYARAQRKKELQVSAAPDQTDFLSAQPGTDDMENAWEAEWRASLIKECIRLISQEVDARTIKSFELFVQQGWPAAKVGEHLGMTDNAVFGAKRRVLLRIRDVLPQIESAW